MAETEAMAEAEAEAEAEAWVHSCTSRRALGVYVRHHRARRELGQAQLDAMCVHGHAVTAEHHHRLRWLLHGEELGLG
jgi:hypothetical protein